MVMQYGSRSELWSHFSWRSVLVRLVAVASIQEMIDGGGKLKLTHGVGGTEKRYMDSCTYISTLHNSLRFPARH